MSNTIIYDIHTYLTDGGDVEAPVFGDLTILQYAASTGDVDLAIMAIAANADVESRERGGGNTPLMIAIQGGHPDMVKLLLENGADPNSEGFYVTYPLLLATEAGNEQIVDLLIQYNAQVPEGALQTPLNSAIEFKHTGVAELLIRGGFGVNTEDFSGTTPLIMAAGTGDMEIVQLLLPYVDDTDHQDRRGRTALMMAVRTNNIEIARVLLEHGADPTLRDDLSYTVFMNALRSGNMELIRLLLEHGADPFLTTRYGADALLIASSSRNGADIVRFLLDLGIDPNTMDRNGTTPLMRASESGDYDVINALMDAGADPSLVNNEEWNALDNWLPGSAYIRKLIVLERKN